MQQSFKNQVIQLVGIKPNNKSLYLTEEGKEFLQQINQPISVVTIAGLYRTGKSYLVNQLLQRLSDSSKHQRNRFCVGSTVQSCTKGLNIWAIPFQANNKKAKFSYLVIDSQGIGSIEQETNYDINLLMLIFLISSTVIYNSVGAIDEQSLDQLRVIINMKNCFNKDYKNTQPRLVWVLRDFALQLINKKGEVMSSNQYLQDCLQVVNSSNKQVIKKNEIRLAIKQNLVSRQCHTLVRPTIKEDQLSKLNQLPKNQLREQFVQQLDTLHNSIFRNAQDDIKYLNQKRNYINGPALAKMIGYYLNQINLNNIPEINSVWQLIQSTKFNQIAQQCQTQLKRQILKIELPLPQQQLKLKLNQIQNSLFSQFEKQISSDLPTFKKFNQIFIKITGKINAKIKKANQDIKKKKNLKSLRDLIRKQIEFQKIDPCEIMQIKDILDKFDLKNKGDNQIYEYLLTTIFDIMYIAQQKSIHMKNQLQQMQQSNQNRAQIYEEKEEQIINLKQNYHQSLKQITFLKSSSITNQQDLAVSKQQIEILTNKYQTLSIQKLQKQQDLRNKIEQLNDKLRKRSQESNQNIKHLRQENQGLANDLEETKKHLNQKQLQQRKQVIFQEKMKQSWDRFQEQRCYLKKELQRYKSQYLQKQEQCIELSSKFQKLQLSSRSQKQGYEKKQAQFCEQLRWMKENYSKTKDAYNQSMNTKMQNERILQDVTLGSKKRSTTSINQILQKNIKQNLAQKNSTQNNCSNCQVLRVQKQLLVKEINSLKNKFQKNSNDLKSFYEKKIQNLEQQNTNLHESSQIQRKKFYSYLEQLKQSKQQQRNMYQDSIMRLLNNIENCDPGLKNITEKRRQQSKILSTGKNKKYMH